MKKKIEMKVVNPHAAGIDIGSRSHFVAVGQDLSQIKEFGISHSSHLEIIQYLKSHKINTLAMESTGSYWQGLYLVLVEEGFDVLLVPGAQIKSFRKTDIKDARHIQQLHTLGLLSSCFLPDQFTGILRELARHRKSLIQDSSRYINRIQKCLRLMNFRLDVVVSDVVGVSGRKIIYSILGGERDTHKLALLADRRVKKSTSEISDALHGNFVPHLLFEMRNCLEMYEMCLNQVQKVEEQISIELNRAPKQSIEGEQIKFVKKQLKGKNQPRIDMQSLSYRIYGVDLSAIPCVSSGTLLTLISELGSSIEKFNNSKGFTSWLRLAPNNKISGGKVLSSTTPKGKNPLSIALRDAANVVGLQKNTNHLTETFRRIGLKKGRCAAITAVARKLAVIIYNMIKKKVPFSPELPDHIKEKIEYRKKKYAINILKKYNITAIDNEGVIMS
jgi:transposase